MGHRDIGLTDCPGRLLYAQLSDVRHRAHALLAGPVSFTSVRVDGDPVHAPEPVRIRLGLDRRARWRVTIRAADGTVLAAAHGRGRRAVLRWDGQADLLETGVRAPVLPQQVVWSARASSRGTHDRRHGSLTVDLPNL
jgi:hypothetical protein